MKSAVFRVTWEKYVSPIAVCHMTCDRVNWPAASSIWSVINCLVGLINIKFQIIQITHQQFLAKMKMCCCHGYFYENNTRPMMKVFA